MILGEPGSEDLAAYLEHALVRLMPAAIRVELGTVIETRLWPGGQDIVDRFLRDAKIDIVAVDEELAARAMSGWRRYGKGRHPAALNFGDCFTYALAEQTGYPSLVAVAFPWHPRDKDSPGTASPYGLEVRPSVGPGGHSGVRASHERHSAVS